MLSGEFQFVTNGRDHLNHTRKSVRTPFSTESKFAPFFSYYEPYYEPYCRTRWFNTKGSSENLKEPLIKMVRHFMLPTLSHTVCDRNAYQVA